MLMTSLTPEGRTPLHYAMIFGASEEVQRALEAAWPEGVAEQDARGATVLHLAIKYRCNHNDYQATIVRLLASWPGATKATDRNGNTPLHVTAEVCPVESLGQVVAKLAAASPEPLQQNRVGNTPLQIALRRCDGSVHHDTAVLCMLEQYPNAVKVKDAAGNMALHTALDSRIFSLKVIDKLLQLKENAAEHANNKREYPLHVVMSRCRGSDSFLSGKDRVLDQAIMRVLVAYPIAAKAMAAGNTPWGSLNRLVSALVRALVRGIVRPYVPTRTLKCIVRSGRLNRLFRMSRDHALPIRTHHPAPRANLGVRFGAPLCPCVYVFVEGTQTNVGGNVNVEDGSIIQQTNNGAQWKTHRRGRGWQ